MTTSHSRLALVSSSLQLGKGGIKLISSGGVLAIQLPNGSATQLSGADPTTASQLATKNYVDTSSILTYNASGTLLKSAKRIVTQTTTNSSGAFSVTLPNLGQTQVLMVNATAISGSSATVPSVMFANVKAYTTTSVSGLVSEGTGVLIGGNSIVAAGSGVVVMLEILVQ